jgi:hypothetical protein
MGVMGIAAILYITFIGPFPKLSRGLPPKWLWLIPLAALLGLAYNWYQLFKKDKKVVWFRPILLFLAIPCILYIHWLVGFVFIVLGILERYAKKPMEIGISDKHIAINTLPRKVYEWTEIENVILRDDILTIDLADNHILQKQVNTAGNDIDLDKDVINFNEFCKQLIEASRAKLKSKN